MKIFDALAEMERLYPNDYVYVGYGVNSYADRRRENEYKVYHSGDGGKEYGQGRTWREAINDMLNSGMEQFRVIEESCDDGEPRRSELDLDQIAHEERMEDARNEAVVMRREMREGGKV